MRISGHAVVHVRIHAPKSVRALEAVVAGKRWNGLKLIWSGLTGPQGRDGEYAVQLKVGPRYVLTYQSLPGLKRCDQRLPRLFLRAYDFAAGKMRPISPMPRTTNLPVIKATPHKPAQIAQPAGMAGLVFGFASTRLGDDGRTLNLVRPRKIQDGNAQTAWVEGKGGLGVGEFLEARGLKSPYRVIGLRFVPGHGKSPRAFRAHNRLRSFVVWLGPQKGYLVEIEKDPAKTGNPPDTVYWALFPKPVDSRCATIILRSAFASGVARAASPGGRTAIAEMVFLSELDRKGGIKRLLADVESGKVTRDAASQILRTLGPQAVARMRGALSGAGPAGRKLLVEVLYDMDPAGSAATLVSTLPGLPAYLQDRVLTRIVKLETPPLAELVRLLDLQGVSLTLRAKVLAVLGRIGTSAVAKLLRARLGRGVTFLRRKTVDALAAVKKKALDTLDLMSWPSKTKATEVADRLWVAGLRAAHNPTLRAPVARKIMQRWRKKAGFTVKFRALQALGRCFAERPHKPSTQIEQLHKSMVAFLAGVAAQADDELLRWAAVRALGRSRQKSAVAVLKKATKDGDPRVRVEAISGLFARKEPHTGYLALSCALADPWSWARIACFRMVAKLCPTGGGKQLVKALELKAGPSDRVIFHTLASCRYPQARTVLAQVLKAHKKQPALAGFAAQLLVEMGDYSALERMVAITQKAALQAPTHSRTAGMVVDLLEAMIAIFEKTGSGQKRTLAGSAPKRKRLARLARMCAFKARAVHIRAAAARLLSHLCEATTPTTLRTLARDESRLVQREALRGLRSCPRR
jgi:hypothetical protein